MSSTYLSASELADLIGCKPNQRSLMTKWLDSKHWPYVVDRYGLPKVTRAYHDARLTGEKPVITAHPKYATEPNRIQFDELIPRQNSNIERKAERARDGVIQAEDQRPMWRESAHQQAQ